MTDRPGSRLALTLCSRPLPADGEEGAVFAAAFERAGADVSLLGDEPERVPDAGWLVISHNAAWYPGVVRRLLSRQPRPRVAIWHSEPLPPPDDARLPWPRLSLRELAKIALRDARATDVYTNYWTLRRLARAGLPDLLVASGRGRQRFLAERGIQGQFAPLGYHPAFGRDLALTRDIDVFFLGAPDVPRRRRLIGALEASGVRVGQGGSWFDPKWWGDERTRLLNRTKILLNLARTPGEFSGMRLLLGMANKALVVSEPIYDPEPYVPGEHFVMVTPEEMPARIRFYLEHEQERRRVVDAAYPFALQEVTLDKSVRSIVGWMIDAERSDVRRV